MSEQQAAQAQENGYRVVKTLPPVKFGTGPEWPVPVDIALAFMQSVYQASPELFGKHMLAAATGTPAPPGKGGRQRNGQTAST
jgi:hypothetical protein